MLIFLAIYPDSILNPLFVSLRQVFNSRKCNRVMVPVHYTSPNCALPFMDECETNPKKENGEKKTKSYNYMCFLCD